VKHRDENGREYMLLYDELADVIFYLSLVLTVAVAALATLLIGLP
jgi:hypothetical protein